MTLKISKRLIEMIITSIMLPVRYYLLFLSSKLYCMKIFFTIICFCPFFLIYAQDQTIKSLQAESNKTIKKETDTAQKLWRKGGLFSLNLSQGSLSNWSAGGDDFSLSVNLFLNVFAFYKKDKYSWDNTLDLNFGYLKTTSLGARKNDDRIDLLSKYGYALKPKLSLSGLFNFRTQAAKGYNYTNTAKTLTSAFLSPAYLLVSIGLDYKPTKDLSIFISPVTSRWVIVNNAALSALGLYGVTPGKKSRNEIGAFASINYLKALNNKVGYKARLDLFSNYKQNAQNIDLFMTNVFTTKLSKILAASWNIDLIYDDDVRLFGKNKNSPGLQFKSLIGVGLSVKL